MYDLYIVRRTQIYLEDEQGERLVDAAAEAGVTVSSLIRRAVDSLLDEDRSEGARLQRLRVAAQDAAGVAPHLPAGSDYVDSIRPDYGDRDRELWGEQR